MRRYLLISLMLASFTVTAGIYKWVDDDGNIHYSDKEESGSEQVALPETVTQKPETTSTATTSKTTTASKTETQEDIIYIKMAIIKPKMNETIRNNNGDVEVEIELMPLLKSGDTISIYLDGSELLKGLTQKNITLHSIDRGSHTLKATVFDKDGVALISSNTVIFHLKIEAKKPEDSTPKDNSQAYTPDYNQESESTDYSKDYSKDYSNDYSKDYGSSGSYKSDAEKYKTGVPSSSGTHKSGSSTYTPNYKQK